MVKDNLTGGVPEDLPEHIKQLLSILPKRKKPGRNEPCPCGSGKKYKHCCLGKDSAEKSERYFKNHDLKQRIITVIQKYPDDSYLLLRLDKNELGISSTYGPYYFKDMALYFARNKIKLNETDFDLLFEEIRDYLEKDNFFSWMSNKILNIDLNQTAEIELIFMGFHKDFVLKYLNETDEYITDLMFLQRGLLNYIGKMIHDFLDQRGFSSSYPRFIKNFETEEIDLLQEQNKDFYIECRPTQKLLYTTSLLGVIKEKCDSEIEFALAKELAINNVPFIQQQEITKSFPYKIEVEHVFTKPDLLLWNDKSPIAIYCDGHDFHKEKEDQFRDRNIDRRLQSMGFIVLRYTGSEIYNNIDRCVEEILSFYIGSEWSKTPKKVLLTQFKKINPKHLNEWEKKFYYSMFDYLDDDKRLSLKQERILKKLLDKSESKKNQSYSEYDYLEYELKSVQDLLDINPQNEKLWYDKSILLLKLNHFDEALTSIDKAVGLNPNFDFAWGLKSYIHFNLSQCEEALKAIDKVLEIDPEFEEAWSDKSTFLLKLNRYDEALSAINESLRINPDLADSWSNKSNVLYAMKAFDEALEVIDRAIEINPDFAGAWSNRANILNSLNLNEEALESIEKALELDSKSYGLWSVKCTILFDLGNCKEALEAVDEALKYESNDLELWTKKSFIHTEFNELDEALESINQAIRVESNDVYSWMRKGIILNKMRLFSDAIKSFNKVLSLDANLAEAWYSLGCVYASMDNNDEALSCLNKSFKLNPSYKKIAFEDENLKGLWK